MRDGAKHSEAEVDRGNMTSKRLVSWRSLNPRSLPPLGFSHFTRSPHGVSEVRHEPREGREVGERYGHSRRLRLSRSLLSPRLFPPLSIPALSLPSFFRSERAAGEWREGKRTRGKGKLKWEVCLMSRVLLTASMLLSPLLVGCFVPGSLVTSLTLHSHPRSRGERSGSERSEKERNEPREMGCEGGRGSFTQPLVLSSRVFHLLPSPRPAAGMNERRGTRRQGGKRLRQNDPRTQPLRSVVPSVLGSFHSPHTSVSRS